MAGEAVFQKCGRDLNAAKRLLGWPMKRVVEFYYCVWKYSPEYQQWKAARVRAKGDAGVSASGDGAG